jgi:predicted RNase H-like HicB family nuclease
MADDIIVYFKEIGERQWVAATGAAPYFCFEADSREAVRELAKNALQFYWSASDDVTAEIKAHRERDRAIPTFDPKEAISAKELVAA